MARKTKPTGAEIAQHAKQAKLDHAKTVHAKRVKDNVRVQFTPALFETPKKKDEVENGIVVGQGDVDFGQYQTELRAGKYHLFLAKENDTWKGYAEFDGAIAVEAKRVEVKEEAEPRDLSRAMPTVEFGSICFSFCITVVIPLPFPPWELPVPYCWTVCY